MAGVESLFSGTRPIVYDLPSFRWYRGHAEMITPASNGSETFERLAAVLASEPRPVSDAEMGELHAKFAWQTIVPSLFERVRSAVRNASRDQTDT